MDRGSWQVTVHGVAKTRTCLSAFHFLSLFKSRVYIFPSLLCLPKLRRTARCYEGSFSWYRTPWWGIPVWGLDLPLLGKYIYNYNYSPICESPTLGLWVLTILLSLPLLFISLWFLLYMFSCIRCFCDIFWSFSLIVGLLLLLSRFSFVMPLGGGKLRVIILCHLGWTLLQFFLKIIACTNF